MIEIINKKKCSGCYACVSTCPKNCISMQRDEEGFLYPSVNEKNCIKCGLCIKACPILIPSKSDKTEADVKAYAVCSEEKEIRRKSSSGGIFSLIAENVINKGGVVFGASFNGDLSVSHKSTETIDEIAQFRGSKYVQSTIGDTYKNAKEYLDDGRLVLFTGTPCQIGGLYSYLNKTYDNLITQDIICHGVPSPLVWQKYLQSLECRNGDKVTNIYFRDKRSGWTTYSFTAEFESRSIYSTRNCEYMKAFLSNLCLRPSCYDCSFKSKVRQSDITLADFWGIDNIMPEMNDEKGTSLVFVNSPKGQRLFDEIKAFTMHKEADINQAIEYNSAAIKSVAENKNRASFMKAVSKYGFGKKTERFLTPSFMVRLKRKIRSLLK